MDSSRVAAYRLHAAITLVLVGGGLTMGYLSQPEAPNWRRWLVLAACQVALGLVSAYLTGGRRDTLRRLAIKTALWPAVAAGLAGAARLCRIEVFAHLHALAVIALAVAHGLGERISAGGCAPDPAGPREKLGQPLLDLRWLLAIVGTPWSWDLVTNLHASEFLAGGAAFLILAPLGTRIFAARVHRVHPAGWPPSALAPLGPSLALSRTPAPPPTGAGSNQHSLSAK